MYIVYHGSWCWCDAVGLIHQEIANIQVVDLDMPRGMEAVDAHL